MKTPSRSTMRSWVRSRPSRWTFQYIQRLGAMTGFEASLGPLRMSSASLAVMSSSERRTCTFSSTAAGTAEALGGQIFAHLFAHEHGVRADVNDAALLEEAFDERLDLRIDERLAAADGDHGGIALLGGAEAILKGHEVLDRGGVLTDAAAAGAGEVAGMQRLKLKNRGELFGSADLVLDDIRRDFRRECQWKSHTSIGLKNGAIVAVRESLSTATLPAGGLQIRNVGEAILAIFRGITLAQIGFTTGFHERFGLGNSPGGALAFQGRFSQQKEIAWGGPSCIPPARDFSRLS